MCPCSCGAGTAVCWLSAACTCCSASPWLHPKIFKCGQATHANVATAHFPRKKKPCCSLSNITSNHFPRQNTPNVRQPGLGLPDPFLPASSLILCHADGCNCRTLLWWTTLTCGGSRLGGRQRTAAEAESSVGLSSFGPLAVVC